MKKLVVFIVTVLVLQLFFLIGYADGEEIEYNVEYNKAAINVGDTVTASFSVSGGSGKYKTLVVAWYLYADGGTSPSALVTESFSGKTSGKISCTPNTSGEVCLFITVTDSVGRSSHKTFPRISVTGKDSVTPITITATSNADAISIGDTVTATFKVSGGSGEYSSCVAAWYLYADGGNNPTAITIKSFDGSGSIACKPEASGTVRLFVTVTDSDGRSSDETFFKIPVRNSSPVIPGDTNSDGIVDLADALLLLKKLEENNETDSGEVNIPNADVNGDKLVNIYDLILILQYIAGWEGVYLQ